MTTIATLGPKNSHAWQAAQQYRPAAIKLYPHVLSVINAFNDHEAEYAIIPVYNTREGEIKDIRLIEKLANGYWVDNVVLPIHLSLGALDARHKPNLLIGAGSVFRQCAEYISEYFPDTPLLNTLDLTGILKRIREEKIYDHGVIAAEGVLKDHGLKIIQREMAQHNRTRFAVLGREIPSRTGYDATVMITAPLKDRVGLLYDMLGEFSRRGVNFLDLHSENDIKSQKLQIYIEAEGHCTDEKIKEAVSRIERHVIQEEGSIRVLGSFPRVDMRTKLIRRIGFIGTGEMSVWFAERLENEGYKTILTGRSTKVRPEEMIKDVEVVIICVPISATAGVIKRYAPMLDDGQALILLAGEAENTVKDALDVTGPGVEVMLVHNLWGPRTTIMKDKNASVVRTAKSGVLCSEFESFLYKHGAAISMDSPVQHDLLIGVSQKLPTTVSTALAMTMRENHIKPDDIESHATLTSLYPILAMARVHYQNPRTYAEIMAAHGEGRKIVRSFADNLRTVLDLAESGKIDKLCAILEENRGYLNDDFLEVRMRQALAVDASLGKIIRS